MVTPEQLIEIEKLYKEALPLPNPDIHEVIGEKIDLAPSKVFFGINLIRDKMKLPKLEYPKRKLAVSPEQLMAIETLYEPYLPVPPIGIHKIISKQLRLDEWRVHVGIGLIRKNRSMDRWNEDREDLPAEMKKQIEEQKLVKAAEAAEKAAAPKKAAAEKPTDEKPADEDAPEVEVAETAAVEASAAEEPSVDEAPAEAVEAKPTRKRTTKKAAAAAETEASEEGAAEVKKPAAKKKTTTTRAKKVAEPAEEAAEVEEKEPVKAQKAAD